MSPSAVYHRAAVILTVQVPAVGNISRDNRRNFWRHIHGKLYESGWRSDIGFPRIVWKPSGSKVNVYLFVSDHLPEHWQRLDNFEGEEYRRSLVPVHGDKGVIALANIYEIRRDSFAGE
ncbi:MAG: gamma-glutamylcyclotransferase family protein [Candidatus Odinarchaeota archaeon]